MSRDDFRRLAALEPLTGLGVTDGAVTAKTGEHLLRFRRAAHGRVALRWMGDENHENRGWHQATFTNDMEKLLVLRCVDAVDDTHPVVVRHVRGGIELHTEAVAEDAVAEHPFVRATPGDLLIVDGAPCEESMWLEVDPPLV